MKGIKLHIKLGTTNTDVIIFFNLIDMHTRMHIHKIYHVHKWEYLIIRRAGMERNAPQDTIINCAHGERD